jgi:hypothetical protein
MASVCATMWSAVRSRGGGIYLSRSETVSLDRKLNEDRNNRGPVAAAAAPAAACSWAGLPGAGVCGVVGEFSYSYLSDVTGQAARDGGCLRIRFIPDLREASSPTRSTDHQVRYRRLSGMGGGGASQPSSRRDPASTDPVWSRQQVRDRSLKPMIRRP